jgi:hypothetical protein
MDMESLLGFPMVRKLMNQFAETTGLMSPKKIPRRYLWTDAFAVCNFLELYSQTGEAKYLQLAVSLVDQVHTILGRHRPEDARKGWISGLEDEEGKKHPTKGGLRIGKSLDERKPEEPPDEKLEWDRDGQYYHYLTKWMHALHQISRTTQDSKFTLWALELAKTAHAHFVYDPGAGRKRMYWKMSIDLSYPLVSSMGHHDPLDGLVTYCELQSTAPKDLGATFEYDLAPEISEMIAICAGKSWVSDDPLGIGGLLADAYRVFQLTFDGGHEYMDLLEIMLKSALPGLKSFLEQRSLTLPAHYRLPFREFGLSIGLGAVKRMAKRINSPFEKSANLARLEPPIQQMTPYLPLIEEIEKFWLEPLRQKADTWTEHQDINRVMLATSLAPDGFLNL